MSWTSRQVGPLGAILLPGPVLVTGLLAMQAVVPSDAVNAGLFLAAPLAAVAAVLIAAAAGAPAHRGLRVRRVPVDGGRADR